MRGSEKRLIFALSLTRRASGTNSGLMEYLQQKTIIMMAQFNQEIGPGVFENALTLRRFDLLQARATKGEIEVLSDIVQFIERNAKEAAYRRVEEALHLSIKNL